jgi:superfamily II DNA or RNA helicase
MDKLLEYQKPHVDNIINILKNKNICLDFSDTGTGKTFAALATAKMLDLTPLIICPKTIIINWSKVADIFKIKPLAILNYESVIHRKGNLKNLFIKRDNKNIYNFSWNLPENTIVIFDEAHRCNNNGTLHNDLLMSLVDIYKENIKLLLLSAVIVENISCIKTIGYLFKWYININHAPDWISNKNYNPKKACEYAREKIFPNYGNGMQISKLGNLFPKNSNSAECYYLDSTTEIDKLYKEIDESLTVLKDKCFTDKGFALVKITRARQKIELLKIPIFVELVKQYLENKYSVVIFVNFNDTLNILSKMLETRCIINGEIGITQKLRNIEDFTENRSNIILCNIQAGGESINLNDKYGLSPRISLISPTWSAIKLIQACGRIHRADSKSIAINKIIYCGNTIEQQMCIKVNSKLKDISTLRDDDLQKIENNSKYDKL